MRLLLAAALVLSLSPAIAQRVPTPAEQLGPGFTFAWTPEDESTAIEAVQKFRTKEGVAIPTRNAVLHYRSKRTRKIMAGYRALQWRATRIVGEIEHGGFAMLLPGHPEHSRRVFNDKWMDVLYRGSRMTFDYPIVREATAAEAAAYRMERAVKRDTPPIWRRLVVDTLPYRRHAMSLPEVTFTGTAVSWLRSCVPEKRPVLVASNGDVQPVLTDEENLKLEQARCAEVRARAISFFSREFKGLKHTYPGGAPTNIDLMAAFVDPRVPTWDK